jgi:histone deacetylase 6
MMCCIDIIFFIFIFQLMDLAEGGIALVLEGGYNLDSIAKSMHACLEVFRGPST